MQKLMRTPVFEELNKRSLLGRIIRIYPEMQALVSGDSDAKQETLVVSWESLEKTQGRIRRTREQEDPREHEGDQRRPQLRRSARELRVQGRQGNAARPRTPPRRDGARPLARPRHRFCQSRHRPASRSAPSSRCKELTDGRLDIYTILGAWDGDPEKGIVSYQSALAQALLGHKVGEQVERPHRARRPRRGDRGDRGMAQVAHPPK